MPDDTQQAISSVPSPATGGGPREHHMHLLPRYYRQVEAGRKTIEVRVATRRSAPLPSATRSSSTTATPAASSTSSCSGSPPYPSFEDLLSSEDPARIDPSGPPGELLANLRSIYPPAKEGLGVLAFAFDHRPARPGRPMPMTPAQYAHTVPPPYGVRLPVHPRRTRPAGSTALGLRLAPLAVPGRQPGRPRRGPAANRPPRSTRRDRPRTGPGYAEASPDALPARRAPPAAEQGSSSSTEAGSPQSSSVGSDSIPPSTTCGPCTTSPPGRA